MKTTSGENCWPHRLGSVGPVMVTTPGRKLSTNVVPVKKGLILPRQSMYGKYIPT